ncbi:MAG: hypothetical protein IT303_12520 [Dehalococcoidia bacterium]|nr:hypothetical protein [Dehalococcoidia bacterium]
MKRLFVVLTATVLAVAFAACSASNDAGAGSVVVPAVSRDASATAAPPSAPPDEAERYLVAFAANLDSGAGCHYGDSSGCDIYTVVYDDAAGTVSDLQRLTSSSAAEWFPSLSPDGCFVAYNLDAGRRSTATAMHIASGETVSLGADTRFPDWSPEGDALAWASSGATPQNISIADVMAACDSASIALGDTVQVTSQAEPESRAGDPDFFPGGEALAFHIDGGKLVPSQAAVIATDGTGLTELTPVDGSGHLSVRPDGEAVIAGSSQLPVLTLIERDGDGWGGPTHAFTAGRPASYAAFDGRYGACNGVSPSYPSWLDNDRVMFGLQCNESGRVTFAHLFIAGIEGAASGQLVDLGALVEELAGVDGKSFITASAIPLEAAPAAPATAPAPTPSPEDVSGTVYLTLVSHNEEPNTRQPNFLANPEFYLANRDILVEIVNLLDEYGAAYNFQSDWNFLQAISRYDTGAVTANTEDMNVLRWMSEVMGVEIDPHSHETIYNYADVAYLHEQLGVEPTDVVGGFLYYPYEQQEWEQFFSVLQGREYPDYTWDANILWGAATPGHRGEDEHVSGIWRPTDATNFFVDNPESDLVYVGTCGSDLAGFEGLVADLESGAAPANGFYTASIMIPPQGQWDEDTVAEVQAILDALDDEFATGRVQWANLTDVVDLWETGYGSEASQYTCVAD